MFLIFAFLVFTGLKAAQRRTLNLPRLFILPILLTIWSLFGLYERWHGVWTDACYWIIALVLGSFAGWRMISHWKIHVEEKRKTLTLPGSWSTLILALIIFAIRYSFGYYYATHPTIPHSVILADIILSGIITGMFIGRSLNLWHRYENMTE